MVSGGDEMPRRIEQARQLLTGVKSLPFIFARITRNREQAGPVFANRRQAGDLPSDVAICIRVDDVFRGHFVALGGRFELVPVFRLGDGKARQIPCRARLAADPAQRIGAMPGSIHVNDRTVHGVAKLDRQRLLRAFDAKRLPLDFHFFPRAFIAVAAVIFRVELLDVEVLLIDADGGESPGDALIVTQRDPG